MRSDLLLAIFTGAEATHLYSAFLPSPFTIETFARTPEGIAAIHRGLVLASVGTIGVSWLVGQLIDSGLPLVAGVVTAALMTTVYLAAVQRAQEGAAA